MEYLDIVDKECQKVILKTIMPEKRLAKKKKTNSKISYTVKL